MYEVYSFPACEKCSELKRNLDERNISYEEVNAGLSSGRKRLKELIKSHGAKLKRDKDGYLILPLVVVRNEKNIEISQGLNDCLEKILRENEN